MDSTFVNSFRNTYQSIFNKVFEKTNSVKQTQECLNDALRVAFTNANKTTEANISNFTSCDKQLFYSLINDYSYENTVEMKESTVTVGNIGILVEPIITSAGTHDKNIDGAFFTPPDHTEFMCKESLCQYISNHTSMNETQIKNNVYSNNQLTSEFERSIENHVDTLHILDPSCGAGDFLIGMVRVLTELEEKTSTNYEWEHVLHGADANNSSACLTRLRIDLATQETPIQKGTVAIGDSIIQEVDGIHVPSQVTNGLPTELYQFKKTSSDSLKTVLGRFLDSVDSNSQFQQQTLGGVVQKEVKNTQTETSHNWEAKKKQWLEPSDTDGFYWGVEFEDVMNDGGFDVIVGNPPYVSKDAITDPVGKYDNLEYRKKLQSYVSTRFDITPARNSDLYVYFFFRAFDLLKENGVMSYITSSSWLDSRYGHDLRHGLLQEGNTNLVLTSDERVFQGAEVNAVTSLFTKRESPEDASPVRFVHTDNVPVEPKYVSSLSEDARQITYLNEEVVVKSTPYSRVVEVTPDLLWKQGANGNTNDYENGKWSIFLTAPDVFYDIITHRNVDTLDTFANVVLGTKTGANGFFYLPNNHYNVVDNTDSEVCIEHKESGATLSFPKTIVEPIFCSFRTSQNPLYDMNVENMKWVLNTPKNPSHESVSDYIEWGENHDIESCDLCPKKRQLPFNESPPWTSKNLVPWYVVDHHLKRARLLVRETIDTRFGAALTNETVVIDGTVYGIVPPKNQSWNELEYRSLAAILNSSLAMLLIELYGRTNYGGGALQVRVFEYKNVPMINIDTLSTETKEKLSTAVSKIDRSSASVYEMIQTHGKTCEAQEEIDTIVLEDILGLSEEEQNRVYESVNKLITKRVS